MKLQMVSEEKEEKTEGSDSKTEEEKAMQVSGSPSSSGKLSDQQAAVMKKVEIMTSAKAEKSGEPSVASNIDMGAYARKVVSFLARNFFTMKFIALAIAFLINFMLLFYKVRA